VTKKKRPIEGGPGTRRKEKGRIAKSGLKAFGLKSSRGFKSCYWGKWRVTKEKTDCGKSDAERGKNTKGAGRKVVSKKAGKLRNRGNRSNSLKASLG